MSTFKVSVEQIDKVWPHSNADKLELASVSGMTFQFCVAKGLYKPGDAVVYFPVDSILPDTLVEKFNIRNFLSGSKKDRLKTVKLRGEISQGFVSPVAAVFPDETLEMGSDVTERLGVIKYEVPEVVCKAGRLVSLPPGVSVYDIEGCDRYPDVVAELMDMPVLISEKVEGSNSAVMYERETGFAFLQRRHEVKPDPSIPELHDWIRVPQENGLTAIAEQILNDYSAKRVIIKSEMTGPAIQGNIYKLQKVTTFTFDIEVDGRYLDAAEFIEVTKKYNIITAPILSVGKTLREWLGGKTVQQASSGKSMLYDTLREGIVIKPMLEQYNSWLKGRMFIKMRDPIYLEKTGH
jgi:RNA ligase (TIGR02306 family)